MFVESLRQGLGNIKTWFLVMLSGESGRRLDSSMVSAFLRHVVSQRETITDECSVKTNEMRLLCVEIVAILTLVPSAEKLNKV